MPTLVVAIYLNPHRSAEGTTRELTIAMAERDIAEYVSNPRTANYDILIAGDLNTTVDDI